VVEVGGTTFFHRQELAVFSVYIRSYHISARIGFIQNVEAVALVVVVRHNAIHVLLNAAAVFVVFL